MTCFDMIFGFLIGPDDADRFLEDGKETKEGQFKVLRQEQRTSQKTHIRVTFKTIHATGLIMFAQGANKLDFVSMELYRGKIR